MAGNRTSRRLLAALCLVSGALAAEDGSGMSEESAPSGAEKESIVVYHKSGHEVILEPRGAGQARWYVDPEGYVAVHVPASYVYALRDPAGRLVPTSLLVGRVDPKKAGIQERLVPKAPGGGAPEGPGNFPTSPHPLELTQPDGTRIALTFRGGAQRHWYEDARGYSVVEVSAGYHYAVLGSGGRLVSTPLEVGGVDPSACGLVPRVRPAPGAPTPQAPPTRSGPVPASPHPVEVMQPGGKRVRLWLRGGERESWYVDGMGYRVVVEPRRFVYALRGADGELVPTRVLADTIDPTNCGFRRKIRPQPAARKAGTPGNLRVTQPDGTSLELTVPGDVDGLFEDAHGYTVIEVPRRYVYAVRGMDALVPTSLLVGEVDPAQCGLVKPGTSGPERK